MGVYEVAVGQIGFSIAAVVMIQYLGEAILKLLFLDIGCLYHHPVLDLS